MTKDEAILEIFPHKTINLVIGNPQDDTIQEVMMKMQENFAAVPSKIRGGKRGLSGLPLLGAKYHRDTNHHVIDPP